MQGIPERTFRKYISGKQEVGVYVGKKSVIYKLMILGILDLAVWHDRGNYPMIVPLVIDMVQKIHLELSSKQVSIFFKGKFFLYNADSLKTNSVMAQVKTTKWSDITVAQQYHSFQTYKVVLYFLH